jgi:hypothetical protein
MLVRSFRLPGAETDAPSRAVIQHADDVLNAAGDQRLTPLQLNQVHAPILVLQERLAQAHLQVDAIGLNANHRPDHIMLGYEAAQRAAEPVENGHDHLEEFAPSRQYAELEMNVAALTFIQRHAIRPNAAICSRELTNALDRLSAKLAPMPNLELTERVVQSQHLLANMQAAHNLARNEHRRVRRSAIATRAEKNAVLDQLDAAQEALDEAEQRHAHIVADHEVGDDRATEIKANFPITKTRAMLAALVLGRADVLRTRALPYFFDGIMAERLTKQVAERRLREVELRKVLMQRNFSDAEVKQSLKEWRSHAVHGLHGESVRDHIATTGSQINQHVETTGNQLNQQIEMTGNQLGKHITQQTEQQTHVLIDHTEAQNQKLIAQANQGFFHLEELQANLHRGLRESVMLAANRIIENGRANTEHLVQLNHQQTRVITNAVHAEVDRGIIAGEFGLNNLHNLLAHEQRQYLAEIHQHIDHHMSQTQAAQRALRTMTTNTNPDEPFGNRAKRFVADTFQNGFFRTIGNRIANTTTQTLPPAPQYQAGIQAGPEFPRHVTRSLHQRILEKVAVHEAAHAIEDRIEELLPDDNPFDRLIEWF